MTTLDDQLESLANRLREIQSSQTQLNEAEADTKARIVTLIGHAEGVIRANGKPVLSVIYSRRFSADLAAEVLPEPLRVAISETVISSTKAKATLPPSLYVQCQKLSATPTIKPKVAGE